MGHLIRISSLQGQQDSVDRQGTITTRSKPSRALEASGVFDADEETMLDQLDRRDRLRLVEFVCSFAWADLEVQPEERVFISRLIRRLGLDADEDLQAQRWLERPPRADDVDPTSIPVAHRRIFVEAIEGLIAADGQIAEEESESFEVFKQLLVG